jgi:hypothetical protein
MSKTFPQIAAVAAALAAALLFASPLRAQGERAGPLPPPPDHTVRRIGTRPEEAPPPIPSEDIIKQFSQKEEEYRVAREAYTYRKTIRVQEFGEDGKPAGDYQITVEPAVGSDGKTYEKIVDQSHSTLRFLNFEPEDLETLLAVPAFPLTPGQIDKYDLQYVGKEQVDEVNCYMFQVKPKRVERTRAYLEGVVWIDDHDLAVVKTYGKWVTELGDVHSPVLPFTLFDTYRENVQGKFWFPNYARSDDSIRRKNGELRLRLTVRWTDYKPVAGAPKIQSPAAAPSAKPAS